MAAFARERLRMFGIRYKLLAGLGSLLAILIAVTLLANSVLARYSDSIQRLFRDDYSSATACQAMKESLDALVQASLTQAWQPTRPTLAVAPDPNIQIFERHLATQKTISDLPGERDATNQLAGAWERAKEAHESMSSPDLSPARRQELFLHELLPAAADVRAAAQHIIDMNLANVESGRGAAASTSARARWAMHLLAGVAVAVA